MIPMQNDALGSGQYFNLPALNQINMPGWFLNLERHLPITNKSITYSYLAVSKIKPESTNLIRVIGDTLNEKGKVRQAICRQDKREFFSWLKRDHPQRIEHGSLVHPPQNATQKGNELRIADEQIKPWPLDEK